jgi:hypothetical protein
MNTKERDRRHMSPVWPAALLGLGGTTSLWLWLTLGDGVQTLMASLVLALAAGLGLVWVRRTRAARRLQAALDAYAEREIARYWDGKPLKKVRLRRTSRLSSPTPH